MADKLLDTSGFLIAFGLFYAPFAYGCTTPATIMGLQIIIAAAGVCWLLSRLIRRRLPRVGKLCMACILIIGGIGGWMCLNVNSFYDASTQQFVATTPGAPDIPGSVDGTLARETTLIALSMLVTLCIVADLCQRPAWRTRILVLIALAGSIFVAFGIFLKSGVLDIQLPMNDKEGFPFGTYNYHANAGSLINLVIPAAFGLMCLGLLQRGGKALGVIGGMMLMTCLVGTFVNVSKAATVIALCLSAAMAVWLVRHRPSADNLPQWMTPRNLIMAASGILVVGVVLVLTIGGSKQLDRWKELPGSIDSENPRILMMRVATPMAIEAGMLGNGPGSFKVLMPHSDHLMPEINEKWILRYHKPGTKVSMWSQAHQDYLQLIVEWGWFGGGAWIVILVGGFFVVVWTLFKTSELQPIADKIVLAATSVALFGVLWHALFDFPMQIMSLMFYTMVYQGIAWGSKGWMFLPESRSMRSGAPEAHSNRVD